MPERKGGPVPGSTPAGSTAKKDPKAPKGGSPKNPESKKPERPIIDIVHFLTLGDLEALRELNAKRKFDIEHDDDYDYCKVLNGRLEKAINHLNPGLFRMDPPRTPAAEEKPKIKKDEADPKEPGSGKEPEPKPKGKGKKVRVKLPFDPGSGKGSKSGKEGKK